MIKIHLITKNPGKIQAAKAAFSKYRIKVDNIDREYPEIQAETSLEIARYTAIQAAKENNVAVVREDHSLFINSLAFPGPYTSFIEKRLSANKLLTILEAQDNRTGYFEIATVYAEPSGKTLEFVFQVPVHIKEKEVVKDSRGGWNGIICLKGETRAFTEYPEEERLEVWNKNYLKIAKLLASKSNT